jgi:PHP family Zn ribbon phosphoesterase
MQGVKATDYEGVKLMNFCQDCGTKLTPLKAEPWTHKWRCDKCGTRYRKICGDAMGGSQDVLESFGRPFKNEETEE